MILGAYVVAYPISKGRLPTKRNFCNNHTYARNINAKKPWGVLLWNKFVIQLLRQSHIRSKQWTIILWKLQFIICHVENHWTNVWRLKWSQQQAFEWTMFLDNNISINQVHCFLMFHKTWHTTHNLARRLWVILD